MTLWPENQDASIGGELRRLGIVAGFIGTVIGIAVLIESRYNQQPVVAANFEKMVEADERLERGWMANRCATLWMQKRIALLEQERARVLREEGSTAPRVPARQYLANHYEHEIADIQRSLDLYQCGLR